MNLNICENGINEAKSLEYILKLQINKSPNRGGIQTARVFIMITMNYENSDDTTSLYTTRRAFFFFFSFSSRTRRPQLQVVHYRDDVHVLHARAGAVVLRHVLRAELDVPGPGDVHPVLAVLRILVVSYWSRSRTHAMSTCDYACDSDLNAPCSLEQRSPNFNGHGTLGK